MFETPPISKDFDFKHYIETNTSSANRTRWITIALVLASVVIFIGFYNSMKISWASFRIDSQKDFENVPENNIGKINNQKPLLDDYFGKDDFDNFKDFACRFNVGKFENEPASQYILESLNTQTKNFLAGECGKDAELSEQFIDSVKNDLNRILQDRFLYDPTRFSFPASVNKTKRQEKIDKIIAAINEKKDFIFSLKESDLIRFNRLLLEEAYNGKILESKIPIPSAEKQIAKEIPSRIAFDDKVLFVEMPFFDIPIDINDLGLIGGIALFIILLLLRFSQSREIKNLNLSFKEAVKHDKLCEFYHALAMHQVLTVPQMDGEIRNKGLAISAKLIYFLPIIVLVFGVGYDYYSVFSYNLFEWNFVKKQLYFQIPCIILVIIMSLRCLERQLHIDTIWVNFYEIRKHYYKNGYSSLILNYYQQKQKKERDEDFEKELIRICEYYFPKEPPPEENWLKKLVKSGIYNLKELGKWIDKKDNSLRNWLEKKAIEFTESLKSFFIEFFHLKELQKLHNWIGEKKKDFWNWLKGLF